MPDLADLAEEYLEHVAATRSTHTASLRRTALARLFVPWAATEGVTDLDAVTPAVLDQWSRRLQTQPGPAGKVRSPASVQTYCRELNLFLKWCAKHARGDATLRADAPPPRGKLLDVLTREEIDQLEAAATAPRDALIVRLLADTGIRVGELVNLRLADFVRERGRCFVAVRGKTGPRVIAIEPALYRRIRDYAEGGLPMSGAADVGKRITRGRVVIDEDAPLFVALAHSGRKAGSPLTPHGVQQVIHELGHQAGLRKRVYPHLLRHSYATEFYRRTKDSIGLKTILGHTSLAMIERVYVHLAADDVHDAMMGFLRATRKKATG